MSKTYTVFIYFTMLYHFPGLRLRLAAAGDGGDISAVGNMDMIGKILLNSENTNTEGHAPLDLIAGPTRKEAFAAVSYSRKMVCQ